jgi:hypothetical protein
MIILFGFIIKMICMKIIGFILGLGIFTNFFAQISINTGLVRNYPFNGNANDIGPNAQHGFVNGATLTTDRFGNPNSAYSFDGINDFIDIWPYDSLLVNNYTYSLWTLLQSIPALATKTYPLYIGDGRNQSISACNMLASGQNGWTGYGTNNILQPSDFLIFDSNNLVINTWQHIVLTRSDYAMKLYVNGVLETSDSTNLYSIPTYGTPDYMNPTYLDCSANIGMRFFIYPEFFHGKIDDVMIYKRALNASEIGALYNANVSGISETNAAIPRLELSPNPTSGKAYLKYNFSSAQKLKYMISSLNGKTLKSESLNSNSGTYSLDLSDFDNGIYFYSIIADDKIIATKKLVIAK